MDQVLAESEEELKAILKRIRKEMTKRDQKYWRQIATALVSVQDAVDDVSDLRQRLQQEERINEGIRKTLSSAGAEESGANGLE